MTDTQAIKVFVPRETAALSMGADDVVDAIRDHAGKSGCNIDLIRNGSRGMSWLEPLVEVQQGNKRFAYGPVSAEDVAGLFEADFLECGSHDLALGETEDIQYLKSQQRWTFRRCGIIDPLSIDDYRAHGGFDGFLRALDIGSSDTLNEVSTSGLRGRGGAGFPTGIKWKTAADADGDQKYIACNADEGDSGTFSDRILMESDPFTMLEGMLIAGFAVGASRGYIYLRSEYPLVQSVLDEALSIARNEGWLGENIQGSNFDFDIELHIGAGSYICGEETAMLESLEGKAGLIRFKPPLPALEGLFGKPTVVNNVVTLGSVPDILRLGVGVPAEPQDVRNRSQGTARIDPRARSLFSLLAT